MYLTTAGQRSRVPREIEIWFTQVDGRYCGIAEHGERAQWVRDIRGEPRVRARVGGAAVAAVARVVDAAAEPDLHAAMEAQSRQKYGWGDGLIVELALPMG